MPRGLSAIVATVLILMLTILAGSLIAGFIVPFIRDGLSKSTSCVNYQTYFTFDDSLGFNCYRGANYFVSIKADTDRALQEGISGFDLVFAGKEGSAQRVSARSVVNPVLQLVNGSSYTHFPGAGDSVTYIYDSGLALREVRLYTVLADGTVCKQQTGIVSFTPCVGVA